MEQSAVLKEDKLYTYKDYCSWDTDEKYELFDGVAVMQARPSVLHQDIEGALIEQLRHYLKSRKCRAYNEVEVLLPVNKDQKANDVRKVFVPDIIVVCEPEKIKKQHCFGAPTVIMEIVSPSTIKNDVLLKLNIYQSAGVPEYWIVYPNEGSATVFLLKDGFYQMTAVYTKEDTEAKVFSLEGCTLDMSRVFEYIED